jgi:SAM-dependent methyltransferase
MSLPPSPSPRLYAGLAAWWPLLSPPEDYAGEAHWILTTLRESLGRPPATMLELGSGGGNTASHLIPHVPMTLVDIAPNMLEVSRRLNPDAEHVEGDMRNIRLGRTFEAVMIHDAIMYMTTESDLVAALATARAHLAPEGVLIVLPDCVAETFEPGVETGGRNSADGSGHGLRYMAWSHKPAPGETAFDMDFAILARGADGSVQAFHDRHRLGLFSQEVWRKAFVQAGFTIPVERPDPWSREVLIAAAV